MEAQEQCAQLVLNYPERPALQPDELWAGTATSSMSRHSRDEGCYVAGHVTICM